MAMLKQAKTVINLAHCNCHIL